MVLNHHRLGSEALFVKFSCLLISNNYDVILNQLHHFIVSAFDCVLSCHFMLCSFLPIFFWESRVVAGQG